MDAHQNQFLHLWNSNPQQGFAEFIHSEDFFRTARTHLYPGIKIKASSAKMYSFMFQRFVKWSYASGIQSIVTIKSDQILDFLDSVERTTKSNVRWSYLRLLERVFDYLVMRGAVVENPVSKVVLKRIQSKGLRGVSGINDATAWIPPSEEAQLCRCLDQLLAGDHAQTEMQLWKNMRDAALAAMVLGAGLKTAEALSLVAGDVFCENGKLLVKVSKGTGTGVGRTQEIKSAVHRYIQSWLSQFQTEDCLFQGVRGKNEPMDHATAYRRMKKISEMSGIKKRHFGCRLLRSTYAAGLIKEGRSLEYVSGKLGLRESKSAKRYLPLRIHQAK